MVESLSLKKIIMRILIIILIIRINNDEGNNR